MTRALNCNSPRRRGLGYRSELRRVDEAVGRSPVGMIERIVGLAAHFQMQFSPIGNNASAWSMVCIPGPYTVLRPTLPNVYAAGVANAAGLNHACCGSWTEYRLAGIIGANRILTNYRPRVGGVTVNGDGERKSALHLIQSGYPPVRASAPS